MDNNIKYFVVVFKYEYDENSEYTYLLVVVFSMYKTNVIVKILQSTLSYILL